MHKKELLQAVATESGLTQAQAEPVLDAIFESITKDLKNNNKVTLVGFGTFEVRHRSAREGRNPKTGETLHIPATNVPAFKAGKGLKEAVNPPVAKKATVKKTVAKKPTTKKSK